MMQKQIHSTIKFYFLTSELFAASLLSTISLFLVFPKSYWPVTLCFALFVTVWVSLLDIILHLILLPSLHVF